MKRSSSKDTQEMDKDKERLQLPQVTEPRPTDWTSQQGVEPAPSSTGDLNRLKQSAQLTDEHVYFPVGRYTAKKWCSLPLLNF